MPTEPLAFHNGRLVAQSELTLGVHDAGFVSGVTVTDFCRTYQRKLFRWADHLARFRADCAALRIPLNHTDNAMTATAEQLIQHNGALLDTNGELALITFATPGPLGYLIGLPSNGTPTLGMHTIPLSFQRYRRFFADGITLAIAGLLPSDGIVPNHVKHRSRLHWWLAHQAMTDPDAVPVLLDQNGVADTAIGSVLVVRGDRVIRPYPGSVLESVSLTVVRDLCEAIGLKFDEEQVDFRELATDSRITEVLLTGSGFGLAGVRRITTNHSEHAINWPGPVLRRLQQAWSKLVGVDIERQILGGL